MGKSERQSKVFTDHSGSIHNYIFLKSKNQQESIQLHVWENFNNILIYIFFRQCHTFYNFASI